MLIIQKMIYRSDLQNNPGIHYIFGDNAMRCGLGGQAKEMRGEPNAIGIVTKWAPASSIDSYFSDHRIYEQSSMLIQDFGKALKILNAGGHVVWPADGIGTGLSEVPQRAPSTWKFMQVLEERIKEYQ